MNAQVPSNIALEWAPLSFAQQRLWFFSRLESGSTAYNIGGVLRFLAHYIIGAVVWGKYMPDEFFGMTTTSPWFYSLLYNGSYLLPSIILCLVVFAALYKPLKKYFTAEDLKLAQ